MFGQIFYHKLIRKYVSVFGTIFNDIQIQRFDANGVRIQTLQVPIGYGPKQKWLTRINEDSTLDQEVGLQLPRLSFEMTGLTRSAGRQLIPIHRNVATNPTDNKQLISQYVQIPYDITFSLSAMVKNADDGFQILEQIIPYFTPDFSVKIKTIPEIDKRDDVLIILESQSFEDTYEGEIDTRRVLIWNFEFTMRAYMYGPVRKSGIIKRAQIDIHTAEGAGDLTDDEILKSPRVSRIVVYPGVDANGNATTNEDHAINYTEVEPDDDWDFVEEFYYYSDGKKYDPITGTDK